MMEINAIIRLCACKIGPCLPCPQPCLLEDLGDPGTLESGWAEGPKCLGHCPSFFLAFCRGGGVQGIEEGR